MTVSSELRTALRLAYMAGFEASTQRLNGDTRINSKKNSELIMEYLGLEDKFDRWLQDGLTPK